MTCDMCGSVGTLYKTIIESAELNVCHDCSKFGKVIGIVKEEISEKIKKDAIDKEQEKEVLEVIAEDFADKIKNRREQLGLTQKDFAKKLNEKESIIHKIETGSFAPPLSLARKLEKFLHIKLVEEHEEKHEKSAKAEMSSFTIGDLIKAKDK